MLRKAEAAIRRGYLTAKTHAVNLYHSGRGALRKVDYAYNVFKKLHSALQPALGDYPETSKAVKRAMSSYEQTRNQVVGAHNVGEAIVSNVRQRVPELGL